MFTKNDKTTHTKNDQASSNTSTSASGDDKSKLKNYQESSSYKASSEHELQLQKIKNEVLKDEELRLNNKAKRGKMDMFCLSKVSLLFLLYIVCI